MHHARCMLHVDYAGCAVGVVQALGVLHGCWVCVVQAWGVLHGCSVCDAQALGVLHGRSVSGVWMLQTCTHNECSI